jgi:hypothetical protein
MEYMLTLATRQSSRFALTHSDERLDPDFLRELKVTYRAILEARKEIAAWQAKEPALKIPGGPPIVA